MINKEGYGLDQTFYTGMSAGEYCNVIEADFENGACFGPTVTVDTGGYAYFSVASWDAAAITSGPNSAAPPR